MPRTSVTVQAVTKSTGSRGCYVNMTPTRPAMSRPSSLARANFFSHEYALLALRLSNVYAKGQCARPSAGYPSSDELDDLFGDLKHGDFRNLKSVMNRFTSMLNVLTNNQKPVPKPRKPSQPASDTCATSPKPTGDSKVLDEVACLCQAI